MENSKKFLLKICIMFVNDFISIQKKKSELHKVFVLFFKKHEFESA